MSIFLDDRVCETVGIAGLCAKIPKCHCLDPPAAIQKLRNRHSMLQDVADLKLTDSDGTIFLFICRIHPVPRF